MSRAATRLFSLLTQLPTEQRVAIALALADLSQELLTVSPPQTEEHQRVTLLESLESELRDRPPSERAAAIRERTGWSKSSYYRRRKKLSPASPA